MITKNIPRAGYTLAKIAVGGVLLAGLGIAAVSYAQSRPLTTVDKIEIDRYLGVWYEIARKPMYFQKQCDRHVTATYTLNENGNVDVLNRCLSEDGTVNQVKGEAFIQNAPFNSKLKVSFLPEVVRWLPVARGDYWILKIDDDYQTVLVGEPKRKYMWVLSRTPDLNETKLNEYLQYAQSQGYNTKDLIRTKQSLKLLKETEQQF